MSRGSDTKLLHMQRWRSCNELDELQVVDQEAPSSVFNGNGSNSSSRKNSFAGKSRKMATRLYVGRRSAGYSTSSKVKRKKSKTERDRDYDYGEYDDDDDDEGYVKNSTDGSGLQPASPQATYQCIPALERSAVSSDASLSSLASTSTPPSLLTTSEAAAASAVAAGTRLTSSSSSHEWPEATTATLAQLTIADRRTLHADISQFVKSAERAKDAVPMSQRNVHCERNGKRVRLTIGGKDEKKYGFENVLWLILRAHVSGREVSNGQDEWLAEDGRICHARRQRQAVLDKIKTFSFAKSDHPPEMRIDPKEHQEFLQHQRPKKLLICPNYSKDLRLAREEVGQLLAEFDDYAELFPQSAALWKSVETTRGAVERQELEMRVTTLRTWLNTLDDIVDKIDALGVVFEVGQLPASHWLRPYSQANVVQLLDDVQPVFEAYVRRSLNLKGMKRVLARVEALVETSLVKAAILMQRPPQTYAAATVASKNSLQLSAMMKERYGEMTSARFCSPISQALGLPFLGPLFFFLLGVPMQLVTQWLAIRSVADPPQMRQLDELTFEAMMEDARDCVQEAVRIKRNYVTILQTMCPLCALPGYLYPMQFNKDVLDVFEKYVYYVRCWCCSETVVKGDPSRLFLRLEREWTAALACARYIRSGLEVLSSTLCGIVESTLESLVEEYAEEQMSEVKDRLTEYDSSDDDDEGRGTSASTASVGGGGGGRLPVRNYFMGEVIRLVREVKERDVRIFGILRAAVAAVHDAAGYELRGEHDVYKDELVTRLAVDHCLIDLENDDDASVHLDVVLLVDTMTADRADVDECLLAVAEGRPLEMDSHVVVLPDVEHLLRKRWKGRTVKIAIDEEKRLCFTYLRRDMICVIGGGGANFDLAAAMPSFFRHAANTCSSNDLIDKRLRDFIECSLLRHIDMTHCWIKTMFAKIKSFTAQFGGTDKKIKGMIISLDQEFLIGFQVHRDVARLISDAYIKDSQLPKMIVEKCLELVFKWRQFIVMRGTRQTCSLPVWALPGMIFIQMLSEPKWTARELMDNEQFAKFVQCVNECKELLVLPQGSDTKLAQHVAPKHRSSRTSSSKPTSPVSEQPQTAAQRRAAAVAAIDMINEKKRREKFALGRVDQRASKFRLIAGVKDFVEKKAPFEWVLLEQIAAGSFGTVYRALDVKGGRLLAAKKIRVQREAIKLIEGEIDIFRTLQHQNLVKYYGVEVRKMEVVIFMEYCSEGTLERICREGMDLKLVRRYSNSLLHAVRYLHEMKVVHRDIKPANIFLDLHCVLKLGDFGCSSRLVDTSTVYGEFVEFVGTPQYMAPEMFSHGGVAREDGKYRGYGRMVDVWSVGCVVLQMLTGHAPWAGMDKYKITWEMCEKRLKPAYPAIAAERQDLATFLDLCFVYEPQERACPEDLLQTTFANVSVNDQEAVGVNAEAFEII